MGDERPGALVVERADPLSYLFMSQKDEILLEITLFGNIVPEIL